MINELLNSPGFVAVIASAGSIAVAYIANVVAKKRRSRPKDRMDLLFDGYEKLIAQQQEEIARKTQIIMSLESAVARQEAQLQETKEILTATRDELRESETHNRSLQRQLQNIKRDYNKGKIANK